MLKPQNAHQHVHQLPIKLLAWYDAHGRDLPWRTKGTLNEPYRVWLSEVMLQQTTVATVTTYYADFLKRWPKVEDLAAAPREEVLSAWAGLGYYARARNLHACAQVIVDKHQGIFPGTVEELAQLPGVGAYTSAAIATIAFDQQAAAIDGNIERVLSRLYALETPLPALKKEIAPIAEALVPAKRPGDYTQALMDLGATVCLPRSPQCDRCPLTSMCKGRELGIAHQLPIKAPKKAKPRRQGVVVYVCSKKGHLLVERRPDKGLLGGMDQLPTSDWKENAPGTWPVSLPDVLAPLAKRCETNVEHVFTHFALTLEVHVVTNIEAFEPSDSQRWVQLDMLSECAFPTVMKKAITVAQDYLDNNQIALPIS